MDASVGEGSSVLLRRLEGRVDIHFGSGLGAVGTILGEGSGGEGKGDAAVTDGLDGNEECREAIYSRSKKRHPTHPQCHQHHPYPTLSSLLVTVSPHAQQMERSWMRIQHARQKRREVVARLITFSRATTAAGAVDGKLKRSDVSSRSVPQTPQHSSARCRASFTKETDVALRPESARTMLEVRDGGTGHLVDSLWKDGLGLSGLGIRLSWLIDVGSGSEGRDLMDRRFLWATAAVMKERWGTLEVPDGTEEAED
ncbi:MAG: hypothetical protein Q9181_002010 [Wetmoreana brouardii]